MGDDVRAQIQASERQIRYRERQKKRGLVKIQLWVRPAEAEFIKGFVHGWRKEQRKLEKREDAA